MGFTSRNTALNNEQRAAVLVGVLTILAALVYVALPSEDRGRRCTPALTGSESRVSGGRGCRSATQGLPRCARPRWVIASVPNCWPGSSVPRDHRNRRRASRFRRLGVPSGGRQATRRSRELAGEAGGPLPGASRPQFSREPTEIATTLRGRPSVHRTPSLTLERRSAPVGDGDRFE